MIMGRLQKKKIDKILQMLVQGFTGSEISTAVGCSISTVYRIKKDNLSAPKSVESDNYRVDIELAKALYEVFLILEFMPLLGEENIEGMTRSIAIKLTKRIAGIDSKLIRSVLENSNYYDFLRSLIIAKPMELEQNDISFRKEWIEFMRIHWPQKLADLVR